MSWFYRSRREQIIKVFILYYSSFSVTEKPNVSYARIVKLATWELCRACFWASSSLLFFKKWCLKFVTNFFDIRIWSTPKDLQQTNIWHYNFVALSSCKLEDELSSERRFSIETMLREKRLMQKTPRLQSVDMLVRPEIKTGRMYI